MITKDKFGENKYISEKSWVILKVGYFVWYYLEQ